MIESVYEVYVHEVQTDDGYINTLWQINPYHLNYKQSFNTILNDSQKVVYFQHGLVNTAETFMVLEADFNWAQYYLKKNYTIFLGNFRANEFSFKHAVYDENSPQYYEFTVWHHALQDIPAFIKKIKSITRLEKIKYVGFSMGTMTMNIALSESNYVRGSISHYIGLAPIISLKNLKSTLLKKAAYYVDANQSFVKKILVDNLKLYYFWIPKSQQEKNSTVCEKLKYYNMNFCDTALRLISDSDPAVLVKKNSYYFRTFPSKTSFYILFHFAQLAVTGRYLANFDYGVYNRQVYGRSDPPEISLRKWPKNIKYFFASGKDDLLVSEEDIQILLYELENNDIEYSHKVYKWGHLGFILANKVNVLMEDTLNILHNKPITNHESHSLDDGKYYKKINNDKSKLYKYQSKVEVDNNIVYSSKIDDLNFKKAKSIR